MKSMATVVREKCPKSVRRLAASGQHKTRVAVLSYDRQEKSKVKGEGGGRGRKQGRSGCARCTLKIAGSPPWIPSYYFSVLLSQLRAHVYILLIQNINMLETPEVGMLLVVMGLAVQGLTRHLPQGGTEREA